LIFKYFKEHQTKKRETPKQKSAKLNCFPPSMVFAVTLHTRNLVKSTQKNVNT